MFELLEKKLQDIGIGLRSSGVFQDGTIILNSSIKSQEERYVTFQYRKYEAKYTIDVYTEKKQIIDKMIEDYKKIIC